MGSSGSGNIKGTDATANRLVWVRRRNGSWWPGKILSPDELPESSVLSPKSGTPVELLGKKWTTIDWYNLEDSKRVKAFHCAEYVDCIEKAKLSAFHLSKNGVKKTQREEAILHALELESSLLTKDHPECSATPCGEKDRQLHDHVDESTSTLHPGKGRENLDEVLSSSEDSRLNQQVSKSVISFEEQDLVKNECKISKTANDSEEDGPGVKRMRGLQDLGVCAPSSLKRKRSQVAHVHEFLKRKNRRRPLTKVLESSSVLSSPLQQFPGGNGCTDGVPSDSKVSEVESNESMKTSSVKIENTPNSNGSSCWNVTLSDEYIHADGTHPEYSEKDIKLSYMQDNLTDDPSLFDVSLVTDEKLTGVVSDASQKVQIGTRAQSSQSSLVETSSFGSEEKYESACISSATVSVQLLNQSTEKATSEWQSKGKRNSRLRKVDQDDEADIYNGGIGNLPGWSRKSHCEESQATGSKTELFAPQRLLPHRRSRYTVNPKYESTDFSLRRCVSKPCLFDVVVEVKSSYRPQHVPYVSLMSMVNNLPITGHPVTVEILEEGSCNDFISISERYSSNSEMGYSLHEVIPPVDKQLQGKLPSNRSSFNSQNSRSKSTRLRKSRPLSKKTRKLSSLTGSHGSSREVRKPVMEKLTGPSVACIPLKIVFGRINAALSSSFRPVPHIPANEAGAP